MDQQPAAVLQHVTPERLEEKFGWLRDYRLDLERWSEFHSLTQMAIEVARNEGYSSAVVEQLDLRLDPLVLSDAGKALHTELRQFVVEQSSAARPGERLPGSTEILESSFGKLKSLEGDHSQAGFTQMILSYAALLGETTAELIGQALEQVPIKQVWAWCRRHLGTTLQSQRVAARRAVQSCSPAQQNRKSRRPAQGQVFNGPAVPVGLLPLDGNTAEVKTHLENLRLLDQVLPHSPLVYAADTKLDSPENLLGIAASKGKFVCGGVFQPHLKKEFRKLRRQKKFQPVDYCPKSKQHLPPEERPRYEVVEAPDVLEGQVDGRAVRVKYRVIYVWSEAKAAEEAKTRERHMAKIRDQFEAVERNLNKYSLVTEKKIVQRLEAAKNVTPRARCSITG
jgi:hypothetical protein